MLLSEAIRLGSMMRPHQVYGTFWSYADDASCALGAAADALGITDAVLSKLEPLFEFQPRVTCPVCRKEEHATTSMMDGIIHLNDHHKWTRERIADWVVTVEVPTAIAPVEVFHATQ